MSNPHIVLITADLAPWDSDSESEGHLYEFSGPDEANEFAEKARAYIEPFSSDVNVGVYDPEPVYVAPNANDALKELKDWLDLEDDGP